MNNLPESTINLLFSELMGMLGGLIIIPLNAIATWWLKRDAVVPKTSIGLGIRRKDLLLQHKLEFENRCRENEIRELKLAIMKLERIVEINSTLLMIISGLLGTLSFSIFFFFYFKNLERRRNLLVSENGKN